MWIFSLILGGILNGKLLIHSSKIHTIAEVPGDIILGGLFPVHTSGSTACNAINPERGVQRVEAMLFTIDEINNNTNLLPGLQLGAIIRDTCSASNYALEQALQFVQTGSLRSACGNVDTRSQKERPIARGVVGSSYSSVTILVANLFTLFKLPQISYASTSAILSDKRTYPLFARTVPSDVVQARAMARLVSEHGWTYVSTVRSAGDYGDSGMDAFWKEAEKLNLCIAAREVIRSSSNSSDLDAIVKVLRFDFAKARVVVLFTGMDHTKMLLDAVRRAGHVDHFVWIASDGWGRENLPVTNNSRVANGALTIEIQAKPVEAFTEHYLNLGYNNPRNPWFKNYWEELFGCTFSKTTRFVRRAPLNSKSRAADLVNSKCDQNPGLRLKDRIGSDFKQEAKIQFIYDAVYAFAWVLDKLQKQLCPGNPYHPQWDKERCVELLMSYPGTDFYNMLINISFVDDYDNHVAFDENGDGYGQYSIYNYARDPYTGQYLYRLVGDFQADKLTMRARPIWPGGQSSQSPSSQCSEECGFGEIRRLDKKQQCCWSCEPCAPNQRVVNLTHCEDCGFKSWPTENRTSCELLELHYIVISTWYAIVPMTFSSVGICITIAVIVTWRLYSETPIVRATGRELAYVQLSGCLVCFCVPFILLATPSIFTCSLQRILIGLGFAMMYASLLTKTNRIARIFDAAKRTARRPVFISPRSQLVIAGALITLQLALSAIWFGFDTPDTRIDAVKPDYLVIRCAMKDKSFLISLAYNVVLIVVCTAYAVKTRQIPENFNESKFIGFAMYTTCIIWLAFLPMYYATMNNHEIQITTLCISINLSASVMLSCLFLPKLYIIYLRPDKNVRRLTMNNPKARQKFQELNLNANKSCTAISDAARSTNNTETSNSLARGSFVRSSNEHLEHTPSDRNMEESSMSKHDASATYSHLNLMQNRTSIDIISNTFTRPLPNKPLSNSIVPQRQDSITPRDTQANEFPTPTPLILDPIPQSVIMTPTYCEETSSLEEADFIPKRLVCPYEASFPSGSQVLSNPYAAPYSVTDSVTSSGTPRSSDLYLHSYGEDTQHAPSVTSQSPSVTSGSVFSQLRQPSKSTRKTDYSKQTVTAL